MTWHGSVITWTAEAEGAAVVEGAAAVDAFPPPTAGVDDTAVGADGEHADRYRSAAAKTVIHGFLRTAPPLVGRGVRSYVKRLEPLGPAVNGESYLALTGDGAQPYRSRMSGSSCAALDKQLGEGLRAENCALAR
jgi:hypothetical protein